MRHTLRYVGPFGKQYDTRYYPKSSNEINKMISFYGLTSFSRPLLKKVAAKSFSSFIERSHAPL
jgi:hypothetical protein